ncbi:DUF805 domain-containing protein [Leucobacter sp. 1207-22]|uniref:DUF805 domain-containing protein n=1 Tax=Leucobacter sp. 1207-22 TaxID=2604456 RepID=UPI00406422A1
MSFPEPPVDPNEQAANNAAQPSTPPVPPAAPQQPAAPQYAAPQQPAAPQYAAPQQLPLPGPGEPFDGAVNADDLTRPLYGASFGDAVRRFFKNYVNFSGRASRSEYWYAQLFLFLVGLIPAILMFIGFAGIAAAAFGSEYGNNAAVVAGGGTVVLAVIGGILVGLFTLATIIPSIAIGWRRLHDANLPGTLWLLNLASMIPVVNYVGWLASIAYLVLTIFPSKPEGRRFVSTK